MHLDSLIQKFFDMGHATIGNGPKHPDSPNAALQSEITEFFSTYPVLAKDQGYVDFQEKYAGAVVDWPYDELTIVIHGFYDFTEHVLYPDEPLIDDDGYFYFAEVITKTSAGSKDRQDIIGMGFAWDITGMRKPGIYRTVGQSGSDTPNMWYCETFLEWLSDVVEKRGKLF